MATPEPSTASPGRPRDQRIDEAVLAATRALLVEVGYSQLTFEAIAQRAGASRPALYRRWPTKAHVVHNAVFYHEGDGGGPLVPCTGSFEDDLRQVIEHILASYARPEVQIAVPGLLSEFYQPPHRDGFVDIIGQLTHEEWRQRTDQAVADGQLRPGVDADALLDAIAGAVLQRVIVYGDPDPAFAGVLADLLLAGLRPACEPPTTPSRPAGTRARPGAKRTPRATR